MKYLGFWLLFLLSGAFTFSQEDSDTMRKYEIGFDGFANFSNLGGSFGVGLKYAVVHKRDFVFGPSLRIHRMWNNGLGGEKYGFTILGGGGFFHYRFQNILFGGIELEFLRSPINYSFVLSPKQLVPTCFVGGGYSREFKNSGIRLNAGVFYDVVANPSSPFWTSYVVRDANGKLLPIIYRVGFFFALN
ncbi:MAG: hypothetical protein K0R65_291 [Crocinitomicaceae bacterium]|jgi:hypothetical protein|nr:hypothetical protein [Crocinitomicaceae bacterium]